MEKRSSKCILSLVGFTFLRNSIMIKNFQLISLVEKFSLSKQSKAHPRQIKWGMRSFQALRMQASQGSCHMISNNTDLPINNCHSQHYLFYAQDFLKGGKVTASIQFSTEG